LIEVNWSWRIQIWYQNWKIWKWILPVYKWF